MTDREMGLLIAQLKRHEGRKIDRITGKHFSYRCTAGALTLGYGHNLDANPVPGIGPNSQLTEEQAERLLRTDIDKCMRQLENALPWAGSLPAVRYAVLVNMAFNLGIAGLLSFKPTLKLVQEGDYVYAAQRMMQSKWAGQVGDGPGGRFDRAEQLAKQMETGEWQ